MSKAKIVNECMKMLQAGMVPQLLAVEPIPNSVPDKNAVGLFVTKGGGCHIARTSRGVPKIVSRPAGSAQPVSITR